MEVFFIETNFAAKHIALLPGINEMTRSNLDSETDYFD
jgi:hypothetical protein